MCALNSYRETFNDQIFYTQIMTRYDEAIRPINASELNGGTNIYIQDVCDNDQVSHVGIGIYDQIAYLIAMDALNHNESASLTRIQSSCRNKACCQQLYIQNLNQTLSISLMNNVFSSNSFIQSYQKVSEEPKLKCYVTRDCVMKSISSSTIVLIKELIVVLALTFF